jgi:uncharacterized membrane protein YphA (DoxX/SURF4 family)
MSLRPGPKESGLLLILRLALAGVFAFAAWQKLVGPFAPWALPADWNMGKAALLDFQASVEAFRLIGPEQRHLVTIATYAVPWGEALCAVLLVLGLWTRASAFLLTVTLAGFVVAIKSALDRGLNFPCGCFGKINFPCSPEQLTMCGVWRNAALMLPALYILLRGPGRLSFDRLIAPRRPEEPARAAADDRSPIRERRSTLSDVPGT